MRRIFESILALAILAAAPRGAAGQTTLTLEVSQAWFSGGIRDTSSPAIYLRPYHPTLATLRLTGRWLGVALTLAAAPTGATQEALSVVLNGDINLLELAPEARIPLVTASTGARLIVHAGPIGDLWKANGAETVFRLGGQAGASLEFPLSSRFNASIRGDLALSGAHIGDQDLPSELSAHAMWRTKIGLGVGYRL